MSKTIVINSGYFNPIHPGHIECMELSKKLGDELWVIVNNDQQAEVKRGVKSFEDQEFRMAIVRAIKPVDRVFLSVDTSTDSYNGICDSLVLLHDEVKKTYGKDAKIIFAKGGDRNAGEVPEGKICAKYGIQIVDGLGLKTHNSSDYVKNKTIK